VLPELPPVETREQRAERHRLEAEAARLKLLAAVAVAPDAIGGAELGAAIARDLGETLETRDDDRKGRPVALQNSTHGRRSDAPPPPPSSLPQHAKPPPGVPYSHNDEAVAAEQARRRAGRQGIRDCDATHFPAWVVKGSRKGTLSPAHARAGLALVAKSRTAAPMAKHIEAAAEPFGGVSTPAGRNVLMIGTYLVLMTARNRSNKRISGLQRGVFRALTRGTRGEHYSLNTLWNNLHNASGEIDPIHTGPKGGTLGAGKNCGYMIALMRAGVLVYFAPSAHECPAWMVAPSGWSYVQVVVSADPPGDTS
jgi:hypothetical protein